MAKPYTLIRLVSTAGTGHFYTTRKSRSMTDKLKLNKFDPIARKHVPYEEKKIK